MSRDDHYHFTSAKSVRHEDRRFLRSEYGLGEQMRRTEADAARAQVAKAWAQRKARIAAQERRAKRACFVLVFVVLPCMYAMAKGWHPWAS